MEEVIQNVRKQGIGRWLGNPAILVFLAIAPGVKPFPCEAADEPLEFQVKAAFLLNFTKFIEWPEAAFGAAGAPITICVTGDDPFGGALDQIVAGEVVNGHKVAAQRIKGAPSSQSCQVVYVSPAEKDIPRLLAGLGPGILTVGEGETFIKDGGMIAFLIENRRVRFSINRGAAENAGLKLSSKLLLVAKSVENK
jgi:hypothetical protein